MRILVDMNLSPDWLPLLAGQGWEAIHWSSTGRGSAPDTELLSWARTHSHVVLTQDLDFAQILYATRDNGPSVVLLRMDNEFDSRARERVCVVLREATPQLAAGALLTVSPTRVTLRSLPIAPGE